MTSAGYRRAVDNRSAWESEAANWVRWARTPGHDAYWYYRDAFFDRIVPAPGSRTVEVGCGEGRVARDLDARGHRLVAVDGSPTLLRYAVEADPAGHYMLADASSLPLADASADVAVAYNSLMDFDDLEGAVGEVARVLVSGGTFCICLTHPVIDTGRFESEADDAPLRLAQPVVGSRPFDLAVDRDGLAMHFRGWSRSLEEYATTLAGAGFVIEALREPVPEGRDRAYRRWHRYPMFLHLRTRKGAAPTTAPASP